MKILDYFSLIKFSHTIFALPFAAVGFFLAVLYNNYSFNPWLLLYVILCMVFARTAAMAFNRYTDYKIDLKNNRTATREIPSGKISPQSALTFTIINAILFIATTWFINPLCFYLSPVALLVVLGYSFTKRFTFLCHFVLGIGLSLSPIGAYLAVSGKFSVLPIIFSFIVLTWTGGFDIIYALQDEEFDRNESLHSVPAKFGRNSALKISNSIHIITASLVIFAGWYSHFSWQYWLGAFFFIGLLLFQHIIISPKDISRVNLAFGTTNGIASVLFAIFTIWSF
jgi:4-hydroxybenzoate polyprenyltransferase